MKNINRLICIILVTAVAAVQFPITAHAKAVTNVPTFNATQLDVESKDGLWTYDIALDKNDEPRVWITDYHQRVKTELVIPSEIDGMRVQSVDMWASVKIEKGARIIFEENVERISGNFLQVLNGSVVELPSSLLMIDESAFMGARNLTINFPENLTAIGDEAFSSCSFSGNTDIVLPESLKCIGNAVFDRTNITSVKIGSKTSFSPAYFSQTVGCYAISITYPYKYPYTPFTNCASLTKVEIDENNPFFTDKDGTIYTEEGKELVFINSYPADYVVPEGVEYLCPNVFENKTFNSLHIPSSIKNFYKTTFSGSKIGSLTFASDFSDETLSHFTFLKSKIDEITIPKSVKIIDFDNFKNVGLKELHFEMDSQLEEIRSGAFQKNELKTIDLTNCKYLTTVSNNAFSGNSQLESVDMTGVPLEEIPDSMFAGCDKLKNIKLSEYTKVIGKSAFAVNYSSALENVNLDNIAKCDETAFNRVENFDIHDYLLSNGTTDDGYEYNEFVNHVSLIGYTGDGTDLIMPDTINGKPVTDIVWDSSKALKNITVSSIKLPSHLTFISTKAFDSKHVGAISDFPESLRYIGEEAFCGCTFKDVKFNEGLEYVLDAAFAGCPIENLVIPDSVFVYLGRGYNKANSISFGKNMKNIRQILDDISTKETDESISVNICISPDNPYNSFENGVLYNSDKTEIIKSYSCFNVDDIPENYQIPETVKIIDANAFERCNALDELVIPANVEYIGNNAFWYSSVRNVHFADGFKTKTLYGTFKFCENLNTVTFGDVDIKELRSTYVNSSIKNVDIPESVEVLRSTYFFTDLSGVTEIKLPDGLKVLSAAFEYSFLGITEVTIPKGVEIIGPYTFERCKNLKKVDLGNVKYLFEGAFMSCESLETIDLTGVTYFSEGDSGTFGYCPNLKKITYNRTDKSNTIDDGANQGNTSVETVVIGNGVNNVKSKAFADCKNLETAIISDSVETIADNAFENCNKLTIVCTEQSNALKFAQRNSIRYKTFKVNPVPDQIYTGKAVKPQLCVTVGDSQLKSGKDYSASYSNNINPGTARAYAVGLGDYSIYAATVKFNIVRRHQHRYTAKVVKPTYTSAGYTLYTCSCGSSYKSNVKSKLTVPKTKIKKLVSGKKSLTVSFNKARGASGYQVQYSQNKKFKNSKKCNVNAKKTSVKIKKLKANKKYFVRIRTYKKVGNKTYYSAWSAAKSAKTK